MRLIWITGYTFAEYLEFIVCIFRQNVISSTFNQLWFKLHQIIWAVLLLFFKVYYIFSFVFIFSHLWQALITCVIVNVWLVIHFSERWKLSMKEFYCYILQDLQLNSLTGSSPCLENFTKYIHTSWFVFA